MSVANSFAGKLILITGGTGSFGATMAAHALDSEAREVRILSRDEAKQDAMRHSHNDPRVKFFLGDVRDSDSVDRAMKSVDLVFHAAALKQVPSAEFFPVEAVKTNVLGSANVCASAVRNQVSSVVCLSTDKAVYPINAMGMTKALMEKVSQSFAREELGSGTSFSITRYGNVMFSRGSVIPLFISQILQRGKVTVTQPNMTRFLMTLEQSVELVNFAFENARSGDLFVQKAPAARIQTLAEALLELFGKNPSNIEVIGMRHGEKMHESLLGSEELTRAEDLGNHFRVPLDTRDLNYAAYFENGNLESDAVESYSSNSYPEMNISQVKDLLIQVPEVRKALEHV